MKQIFDFPIIDNVEIASGVFSLYIQTNGFSDARAGQFVNVYSKNSSRLLPRPISICELQGDVLNLVFAVVGSGTEEFSGYKKGDSIKISSPMGNGYSLDDLPKNCSSIALLAGGIGTPPMVELAKRLFLLNKRYNIIAVIGFKCQPFLINRLQQYCASVYIATENEQAQAQNCDYFHGNVLGLINHQKLCFDYGFSCGPRAMQKAVAEFSAARKIPFQLSLEERMGCGYGACVGCVCDIMQQNGTVCKKKVCSDGPVFLASEVVF